MAFMVLGAREEREIISLRYGLVAFAVLLSKRWVSNDLAGRGDLNVEVGIMDVVLSFGNTVDFQLAFSNLRITHACPRHSALDAQNVPANPAHEISKIDAQ